MEEKVVQKFPKPFSNISTPVLKGNSHYSPQNGLMLFNGPPMFGPRGSTIPPKFMPKRFERPERPVYQKKPYQKNFCCVPCDIEFNSSTEFNNHKKEHKMCEIDGCRFMASPIAISKHVEMQHDSGLFDKLKNLVTPEDIKKWRNDRKRKYPTKANCELRQKIQEEKMERGERLTDSTSRFGRKEDRQSCYSRGRGRGRGGTNSDRGNRNGRNFNRNQEKFEKSDKLVKKDPIKLVVDDEDDNQEFNNKLPRFKGTSSMYNLKVKKLEITNPLFSLLGMYGSESDDESVNESEHEELPENIIEKKQETKIPDEVSIKTVDNVVVEEECLSSGEEPEVCIIAKQDDGQPLLADSKINKISDRNTENPNKRKRNYKRRNQRESNNKIENVSELPEKKKLQVKNIPKKILNYSKLNTYRPNTLLSRLLQPDIRHERNVLLQCVRHVVRNEFFGIGKKIDKSSNVPSTSTDQNELVIEKDIESVSYR